MQLQFLQYTFYVNKDMVAPGVSPLIDLFYKLFHFSFKIIKKNSFKMYRVFYKNDSQVFLF